MTQARVHSKFICMSVILLLAASSAGADEASPGSYRKHETKHSLSAHKHGSQAAQDNKVKGAHFDTEKAEASHNAAAKSAHRENNKTEAGHTSRKLDKKEVAATHTKQHSAHHDKKDKALNKEKSAKQGAQVDQKKDKDLHQKKADASHSASASAHAGKKNVEALHEKETEASNSSPQAHANHKKADAGHGASQSAHDDKKEQHSKSNKKKGHDESEQTEKASHKKAEKASHKKTEKASHKANDLEESCEELINHGTHFTVELNVGTPAQKFNVVADTGSDAILIPSCQCVEDMYCSNESNCFRGTNKSSTFSYETNKKGAPLNNIKLMFGSGPVEAVVASDKVRVGNAQVMMNDAILLMVDHMLNIKGAFEGILGLGLPASSVKNGLYRKTSSSKTSKLKSSDIGSITGPHPNTEYVYSMDSAYGSHQQTKYNDMVKQDDLLADYSTKLKDTHLTDKTKKIFQVEPSASLIQVNRPSQKPQVAAVAHEDRMYSSAGKNSSDAIMVKGFAETAGIDRFSMCFNDGAPGVLRLQSQPAKLSHGSVGQVHWGLDFRGITVGDKNLPVKMCNEKMRKKQSTPCGAIPDSGTTALMGPKEHVLELFESLCDGWDRCKKNHTSFLKARDSAHAAAVKEYGVDPFELQNATKGMIFQMLLMDCHNWWVKGTGLDELPDLHFDVRGTNGTKQTLTLPGWSYVIETYEKDYTLIYNDIAGEEQPVGKNYTGGSHKVCSPAFSTMDYQTEKNGPVWILGTPIFYAYQVGYDYKASPPAISFTDAECGTCDTNKKTSLMGVGAETASSHKLSRGRRPRQVLGKFRMPSIDVTKPL